MPSVPILKPYHPAEVVRRLNAAREKFRAETGHDMGWGAISRALNWSSAVAADVRTARRPIRVYELGELALLLCVSAGWLAFGEGSMRQGTERSARWPMDGVPR